MKETILDTINSPKDLKQLAQDELKRLAQELRHFIITVVATKAGHLGSSLGVVELTIALHYVFNTPYDTLIWDVGHQAYGHKILTGRRKQFHTNRQLHGISGFPKRSESPYDSFGVGHSSTSISALLGMAIASKLNNTTDKQHIAVIGDASIVSGMAFEGLNHAGITDCNILIILNDNGIGIDPSIGALKAHFAKLKDNSSSHNTFFDALNFHYTGPIDGHDVETLITTLEALKTRKGPKLLHVITTKGKGLQQAEEHQITYHAPGKFDATTGHLYTPSTLEQPPKYQDVFGYTLLELAHTNKKIIGITPAMPTGSSLKLMMDVFPDRALDVGIAEQHAVTLSAGMATQGMVVFCNIYSTFLQRAYDQIIHDVALQQLPVIFCLDRAGLVGEDGATHHGTFDLSYLRCIPDLIIFAPRNETELRNILYTAQLGLAYPIAIRYPRGRGVTIDWQQPFAPIDMGKGVVLKKGGSIALLSIGTIAKNVTTAITQTKYPNAFSHYDMRFVKPLDNTLLHDIFNTHTHIVTIEDGTIRGGFGSAILEFSAQYHYTNTIHLKGIPDTFIQHGTINELQQHIALDATSLAAYFDAIANH